MNTLWQAAACVMVSVAMGCAAPTPAGPDDAVGGGDASAAGGGAAPGGHVATGGGDAAGGGDATGGSAGSGAGAGTGGGAETGGGGGGASCLDNDGDTLGVGCAAGPDCDDQDPTRGSNCAIEVLDLNPLETLSVGSAPRQFLVTPTGLYFTATDSRNGEELYWSSNGADARLVVDLFPGPQSSTPHALTSFSSRLFFVATTPHTGEAIFSTSGTAEDTTLVADVVPGVNSPTLRTFQVVGNELAFIAEPTGGAPDVYVTDGTPGNLRRLTTDAVATDLFTVFNGALYFVTGPSATQRVLWKYAPGQPLARLWPASGSEVVVNLSANNEGLYFTSGHRVYRTAGAAPALVKDFSPMLSGGTGCAYFSARVDRLVPLANRVLMVVEMIQSNCSTTTFPLRLFSVSPSAQAEVTGFQGRAMGGKEHVVTAVVARGDVAYLGTCVEPYDSDGCTKTATGEHAELWRVSGTTATLQATTTPEPVRSIWTTPSAAFAATESRVLKDGVPLLSAAQGHQGVRFLARGATGFFTSSTRNNLPGINFTAYATGGTARVAEGVTAGVEAVAQGYIDATGIAYRLVGAVDDGTAGLEPFTVEQSATSGRVVRDIGRGHHGSSAGGFLEYGDRVFFAADDGVTGSELWATTGSKFGTSRRVDLWSGQSGAAPSDFLVHGGALYFAANDGYVGRELWKLGSAASTPVLVADLFGGTTPLMNGGAMPNDGNPRELVPFGDGLTFAASNGPIGDDELYTHSGTPGASPTQMATLNIANDVGGLPRSLTVVGSKLFFIADDGTHGWALFVTQGTQATTQRLQPAVLPNDALKNSVLVPFGAGVLFAARHANLGVELFTSDGTVAGTVLADDLASMAADGLPANFVKRGDEVFFTAKNAAGDRELYRKTPGSPAALVVDLEPTASSDPRALTLIGNRVFFSAVRAGQGRELCVSNGTAEGTSCLDLVAGTAASEPTGFLALPDGRALFQAWSPKTGVELFVSDGTAAGTALFHDSCVGPCSSNAFGALVSPLTQRLYFVADDEQVGFEPRIKPL